MSKDKAQGVEEGPDFDPEMWQLVHDCNAIMERLFRVGLLRTGNKMHEVVREIGFEVAEQIQKEQVTR